MSYLLLLALVALTVVGFYAGRSSVSQDPRVLRRLLGQERSDPTAPRTELSALEDALVRAGWRHVDHIEDPEHRDEAGRYRYWGE